MHATQQLRVCDESEDEFVLLREGFEPGPSKRYTTLESSREQPRSYTRVSFSVGFDSA